MSNSTPPSCLHPRPASRPMASLSPTTAAPSPTRRAITLLRILPDDSSPTGSLSPNQAGTSTQFPGTKRYTFPLNPDARGRLKGCPAYAVLSYARPRPGANSEPVQKYTIQDTSPIIPQIPEAVAQALHHIRTSRASHPRQPWFVWVDCVCAPSDSDDYSDMEAAATRRRAILQGADVVYACLGDGAESVGGEKDSGAMDVSRLLRDQYWSRMDSVVEMMLACRVVVVSQSGGTWRVRLGALEAAVAKSGGLAETWGGRLVQARRGLRDKDGGLSFEGLWEAFGAWDVEVGLRERVFACLVVSGEEIGSCCLPRAGQEAFVDVSMDFDEEFEEETEDEFDDGTTMTDSYLALAARDHRFGTVLEHIMRELDSLEEECNRPVGGHGACGRAMGNVEAEVARFQGLLRRMDHLERELDRVLEMWEVVRRCRGTVDDYDGK